MKNLILSKNKNKEHSIELAQSLIEITQKIIGTLDYEKVLQIISDGMSKLMEIETAAIYLLRDKNEMHLAVTTPPLPPDMPDSLRKTLLKYHPTIESAILTQKPIVIDNATTAALSSAEKEAVNMRKLRSIVYFPFIQNNKVLGVLILSTCNKNRKYTKDEISLGQGIANQLSVAIENSSLHEDIKKHKENLEELVVERTQELENANEELQTINADLLEKNEIIRQQKEELLATLNNLRTTQSQLIQSEKMASLGVLTAGVAHEINNPLNFILGGFAGIKSYLKNNNLGNIEIDNYLHAIETGVERATSIVRSLGEFGTSEKASNVECDIHSIINNNLIMLQHQTKNKIEIEKQFAEKELVVNGNAGNMHQIFLNLLLNAIQSIENNGKITIKTYSENSSIKIEITDNGCGISPQNLPYITDPFFTTKDPGKGIGLGLSITNSNIKKMNGTIQFTSELNKGTTAIVSFPTKINAN